MYSYAGVPMLDPVGAGGVWIQANIRPNELFPLAYKYWPGDLTNGPVLDVTAEPARPAVLNTLWWPYGASRFAQAHFVVSESQLAAIRRVVVDYAGNGTSVVGQLIMDDGKTKITTPMWMLPAWPLSTAVFGAGMYLLTLVDERYWWWGVSYSFIVTAGVTTWLNLYTQISTALGVTISPDTINAAYGTPVADYSSAYRSLPNVLDAVAFSVGQRIVRYRDGTVKAQNARTARSGVVSQLVRGDPKYAGGKFALLPE